MLEARFPDPFLDMLAGVEGRGETIENPEIGSNNKNKTGVESEHVHGSRTLLFFFFLKKKYGLLLFDI